MTNLKFVKILNFREFIKFLKCAFSMYSFIIKRLLEATCYSYACTAKCHILRLTLLFDCQPVIVLSAHDNVLFVHVFEQLLVIITHWLQCTCQRWVCSCEVLVSISRLGLASRPIWWYTVEQQVICLSVCVSVSQLSAVTRETTTTTSCHACHDCERVYSVYTAKSTRIVKWSVTVCMTYWYVV